MSTEEEGGGGVSEEDSMVVVDGKRFAGEFKAEFVLFFFSLSPHSPNNPLFLFPLLLSLPSFSLLFQEYFDLSKEPLFATKEPEKNFPSGYFD